MMSNSGGGQWGTENVRAVDDAVARLGIHASELEAGWMPQVWRREDSGEVVKMRRGLDMFAPVGVFDGLAVEPGATLALSTRLDLPAWLHQVQLAGDRLFLTVDSLYPVDIFLDGKRVFGDALPVVASGPALIDLVESLQPGDNGELRLEIHFHDLVSSQREAGGNVPVHLSTPRLWERHLVVDATYARLLLARGLAASKDERAAVITAAGLVPPDLEAVGKEELDGVADAVTEALAPVAHKAEAYRVHLVAHSHIDLAWRWRWEDTREVIKRDFRAMVSLMDEFPQFCFTHSQAASYALIEAEEPELFEAVRHYIAEGRWEPAALQWVEGDTNMASGPAQARQVLESARYSRERLGAPSRVFWAPDTFGHAGNMPQLALQGGGRAYYHTRGNQGVMAGGELWPAYWWEGDDGTRVLGISTPFYLGTFSAGRVASDVLALGARAGLSEVCWLYGVGDHGGGPTRLALERLSALSGQPGLPRMGCSTIGRYCEALLATSPILPLHRGESTTVFEGCYTSHSDAKRRNRDGENLLQSAETLATVAGIDRSDELSGAWQKVLFHQFHDILDGSAVHDVYSDQVPDFAEVATIAARVTSDALDRLEAPLTPGNWAVTNPVAAYRREPVVLEGVPDGDIVAVTEDGQRRWVQRVGQNSGVFVAELPALGTEVFRLKPASRLEPAPGPALEVGSAVGGEYPGEQFITVESGSLLPWVRADCGVITTLFDKRAGKELVGPGAARARDGDQLRPDLALGVLQVVREHPHSGTAWVEDELYEERSLIRGAKTRIVEAGPVRALIEALHEFGSSQVTVRITFYADLPRIDFDVEVDWHEAGSADVGVPGLVMSFGSRLDRPEAWYETPFAAARRPADGLVVPALRWADIGDASYGIAVLNDGKYGHEAMGSRLRVHLLRSTYDPDPVAETGRLDRSRFVVMPHVGSWRRANVVAAAAALNQPLLVRKIRRSVQDGTAVEGAPAFRPRLEDDQGAVIAGLKYSHDGSGRIVQLYQGTGEASRTRLVGLPPGAAVSEVSIAEERLRALRAGPAGDLEVALRPFEVRYLLVET